MEARSAAAVAEPAAPRVEPDVDNGQVVVETRPATRASTNRRRPVIARAKPLSREKEFSFIRADMRRLTIISVVLFVLMIVLLLIIG